MMPPSRTGLRCCMRISDEERHEVAENLRNLTIGRFIQYKEQFFDELAELNAGR